MTTKIDRAFKSALEKMVSTGGDGAKVDRVDAMVDLPTREVLEKLTEKLALEGGGNPAMLRSRAIRRLLLKGALVELEEARAVRPRSMRGAEDEE